MEIENQKYENIEMEEMFGIREKKCPMVPNCINRIQWRDNGTFLFSYFKHFKNIDGKRKSKNMK